MIVTISGDVFFEIDDQIWAMHYTPGKEKNMLPKDSFEIWYAAHGSGLFFFENDYMTEVNEGDIYMITPEKEHCFMSLTDPEALHIEMYVCKFQPNILDGVSSDSSSFYDIARALEFQPNLLDHLKSKPYLHLKENNKRVIRNLFIHLIDECINRSPSYKNMMKAYLSELIINIFRNYEKLINVNTQEINVYGNPIVTNIIKYIQFNLSSELNLDDIAKQFYMSSSYLSKLFKKHTGVTIQDYTQTLRIDKVCDLLRNTDRTIEGIADRVGYKSNSYLHKIFKKKTGMTMREYRNKYHP